MRLVVQRVESATARSDDRVVAEIGKGVVLLCGFLPTDDDEAVVRLAGKVARLRIFDQPGSKFGLSLLDVEGAALTVSQFTLYADTSRGAKPSFSHNAEPDHADDLYRRFGEELSNEGITLVHQCPFATRLRIEQLNWGPFTILLES